MAVTNSLTTSIFSRALPGSNPTIAVTDDSGTLYNGRTGATVATGTVTSITAGSGISVTGTTSTPIITNTGVRTATAGTGITIGGTATNPTFTNSGVTSLAGTANNITASASTGAVTLSLPSTVSVATSVTCPTLTGVTTLAGNGSAPITVNPGTWYTDFGTNAVFANDIRGNGASGMTIVNTGSQSLTVSSSGAVTARSTAAQLYLGVTPMATTDTVGYACVTSVAGPPTGVPTVVGNYCPLTYDRTNNKIYVYNGGWKSVLLA